MPNNEIQELNDVLIKGIKGYCKYFGQINAESKKPDGVGIAISTDHFIYEGNFSNGTLSPTYVVIDPHFGDKSTYYVSKENRNYKIII